MVKILDVVERWIKMNRLIKEGRTGNPKQFASQLGISKSHLYNCIDELGDLGIDIRYNKSCSTFEYYGDFELEIRKPFKVIRKKEELNDTNGGVFCQSPSLLDCMQLILNGK